MQKKVVLKNKYMRDELIAAMQGMSWSAGIPTGAKIDGVTPIIVFPELDEQHQLWINVPDGSMMKKHQPTDTVYVSYGRKVREFGGAMARNMVGSFFGFIPDLIAKFSPNEKLIKEQVNTLVDELSRSGL